MSNAKFNLICDLAIGTGVALVVTALTGDVALGLMAAAFVVALI